MKSALTIAGSDPTGGAGLQADLKVFRSMGVYGFSVPAALTAQNTKGIDYITAVSGEMLTRQLDFLFQDLRPDAIKTGMLYSTHAADIVAGMIEKYGLGNLVIDPVAVSSSGSSLVEDGTLDAIKSGLFPLARLITPNIYEAAVFTGINIEGVQDMERAAKALGEMGPETVVITGGHLETHTMDVFYDGKEFARLEGEKIEGEYHGTGCAFSAAVAAMLALGHAPVDAVSRARELVYSAIKSSSHPGKGMRLLNL
jgi:hydroxymethylpyrimidine/phosphomethylpyrimidine kinase